MLKFFAVLVWLRLPGKWQKKFSQWFSHLGSLRISRLLILPSCFLFGMDSDYLDQFEPESGSTSYSSYSEFFLRKYKKEPALEDRFIWPCEGYVCEAGALDQIEISTVKGQKISPQFIFSTEGNVESGSSFVNIFLHNHNYHRIHAPTNGIVRSIERIPGDLVFLRPWFYEKNQISYPSLRNERLTLTIEDANLKIWRLTLVGGFGVGTIELSHQVQVGRFFPAGEELGHFKLGSTVCLAIPYVLKDIPYLEKIFVGQKLPVILDSHQRDNQKFKTAMDQARSPASLPPEVSV